MAGWQALKSPVEGLGFPNRSLGCHLITLRDVVGCKGGIGCKGAEEQRVGTAEREQGTTIDLPALTTRSTGPCLTCG